MIEIKVLRETPEAEAQEVRELVVPQSVFDDVAELQQQVELITAAIDGIDKRISGEILESGQDLNRLDVGLYIIPTSAVAGSLLNKPETNNATGFIAVKRGGAEVQKIMYYVPCNKDSATYYQRAFYMGEWGPWRGVNLDSGWITLPLQNGATAYNAAQIPQYRMVNNQVFIRGVFRGITGPCTVAKLPAAYCPSQRIMFNLPRTSYLNTRFEIETTGEINFIDSNGVINESTWFSFSNTSFYTN